MGEPLLRSKGMTEKNIPPKEDVTVDVSEFIGFIDGFKQAKGNEKDWKEAKERLQEFLEGKLRDAGANVGTINGEEVIRLSVFPKDLTNWKKLKAEHPQLVEQYTSQVDGHRFSAK